MGAQNCATTECAVTIGRVSKERHISETHSK